MKYSDDVADPKRHQADRKIHLFGSLEELRKEKLVPFTLGPLYVFGNIPFDIIQRFVDETGSDPRRSYVEFENFRFVALNGPYGHMLFTMHDETYESFAKWLETVEITDTPGKRFFRPLRTAAACMDPYMRHLNVQTPVPEVIDVWTISATNGMIVPETHSESLPYPIFKPGEAEELAREEFLRRLPRPTSAPEMITFKKLAPHPNIVLRGKQLLAGS